MQAIESYNYAAGIEGFYDLATTFQTSQPEIKLPNFSRFHPDHPLPHAFAGFIHDKTGISGLTILKVLNFLGSLACLIMLYLICLQLWGGKSRSSRAGIITSTWVTTIMAVSHAFWMAALSGEVHLISVAFFLAAVYFSIRYSLSDGNKSTRYLIYAALSASISLALHLVVIFVLPIGFAVLFDSKRKKDWRFYLLGASIVLAGFIFVYGVLLILVFQIDTWKQYHDTLFIYTFLHHVRYEGWMWFKIFIDSWGHVIAYGFSSTSILMHIIFGGFFIFGFISLCRAKLLKPIRLLLIFWPLSYLMMHLILRSRADSVNYWLFVLPGIFIIMGYAFLAFYRSAAFRILAYLLPVILSLFNFKTAIFPNTLLHETDYLFVESPEKMLQKKGLKGNVKPDHKILFLTKDPILTFPEIYRTGSEFGYKNQTILVYCCGKTGYVEPLRKWIQANTSFFIIVDELSDEIGQILKAEGKKYIVPKEMSGEIAQNWLPASIYFTRAPEYRIRKHIRVFYVDPDL